MLHNRLPTRKNLAYRKAFGIGAEPPCPFCSHHSESKLHLFMHCSYSWSVWCKILLWLGMSMVMPGDMLSLMYCFTCGMGRDKGKKGLMLVWHTVMWSIWLARNELIFSNKRYTIDDLVEGIQIKKVLGMVVEEKRRPPESPL
ncbi:hypothetical protein A2U01_0007160 [Trifolium medium]|uniref:Reverse transcriptase zinc-binding domain-containing protein n=1 Tax=Trifolium medium TaxID=97028 RepID=A0A392MGT1_9FABA|nr:hypothetical protein [Trifolium medium]